MFIKTLLLLSLACLATCWVINHNSMDLSFEDLSNDGQGRINDVHDCRTYKKNAAKFDYCMEFYDCFRIVLDHLSNPDSEQQIYKHENNWNSIDHTNTPFIEFFTCSTKQSEKWIRRQKRIECMQTKSKNCY